MKKIYIISSIIILAVLIIGISVFYKTKKQIVFSGDCNQLITQINGLVEEANYCNADTDCEISTEATKFCGCWGLISKNTDLSIIKEGNEKYGKLNCPTLMCGECMLIPQQGDIKCVNRKCVDSRLN